MILIKTDFKYVASTFPFFYQDLSIEELDHELKGSFMNLQMCPGDFFSCLLTMMYKKKSGIHTLETECVFLRLEAQRGMNRLCGQVATHRFFQCLLTAQWNPFPTLCGIVFALIRTVEAFTARKSCPTQNKMLTFHCEVLRQRAIPTMGALEGWTP